MVYICLYLYIVRIDSIYMKSRFPSYMLFLRDTVLKVLWRDTPMMQNESSECCFREVLCRKMPEPKIVWRVFRAV